MESAKSAMPVETFGLADRFGSLCRRDRIVKCARSASTLPSRGAMAPKESPAIFERDRAPCAARTTAQVAGNPANLAFSANSLLTVTLRASDTLAFGNGTGTPSVVPFGRIAQPSFTNRSSKSHSPEARSHRFRDVDPSFSYLCWNALRPETTTISGIGTQQKHSTRRESRFCTHQQ